MRNSESGLLICNQKAGNGLATKVAKEIRLATPVEMMLFHDLLVLSPEQQRDVLHDFTQLFVLGGDGTTFTMLQLVSSLALNSNVTALGLGGENVVAKHMNSFTDKVSVVQRVLRGEHSSLSVPVYQVELLQNKRIPSMWNVHAGFSANVLQDIEALRLQGSGDVVRRYKSALSGFKNVQKTRPVVVEHNGVVKEVLDFGFITELFPFWTSKIKLPIESFVSAVLHTIQTPEELNMSQYAFSVRFLVEMVALQQRLPIEKRVITHAPLAKEDTLTVTSENNLAVDSEVIPEKEARIVVKSNDSGEHFAQLTHLS